MAGSNDVEIRIRVSDQGASDSVRRISGEVKKLNSGDLDGAAMGLAKFGLAVPGILAAAASVQQLAGAAALLPGAIGMAAAIGGTLGLALGGVGDALTATSGSAHSAGAAVQDMSRQFRDANRKIEDAQRGVEDANRRLVDAHRAVADALRGVEDAERNVADASRAYARAQSDEKDALAAIDTARQEAIRTLADLTEAQKDSALSVEGAQLALQRALLDQQKTMKDTKATALDRAEADFRVKEAQDKVSDSQLAATDATTKLTDAQAKGVEGSDQVVAAEKAAADAHQRTEDAARGVADAQRGVADAQRHVADANRGVEDAERGVADAHQKVADAVQDLSDLYAQQAERAAKAAGGADAYQKALAKLSPEARQFVEAIVAMRGAWDDMQRSVQDKFFDGLAEKVTALGGTYIPVLNTGLGDVAHSLNGIASYALDQILDPSVVAAVNVVLANTAKFIDGARTSLGDFLVGFIKLAGIGSEYLAPLSDWLSKIGEQFRAWVETDPEGVRKFIEDALAGLGQLWDIGKNVVEIIGELASGLAAGQGDETFLQTIDGLTQSLLDFVSSDDVQGFLAFLGTVIQMMIDCAPVTLGVIGAILLLQGTIAAVNFVIGAYNAIVEIVKGATLAWTGVQWLLNAAMDANPIGIIILAVAALVAAFIWAWNNIDGFRAFWIGVWDAVVGAFNWAKDGIVAGWDWLMGALSSAAGWIGGVLSGMWNGLVGGAKAAANGAIGVLNGLIRGVNIIIGGLNAVNPFGSIGYVGYIGYLAKGGVASGLTMVGENGPELVDLPSGSRVHTAGDSQRMLAQGDGGQGSGGGAMELRFSGNVDSAFATAFMKLVRTGQIQLTAAN